MRVCKEKTYGGLLCSHLGRRKEHWLRYFCQLPIFTTRWQNSPRPLGNRWGYRKEEEQMCHLVIHSFTPGILSSHYVQGTMLVLMLTWPMNGTKSLPSVNSVGWRANQSQEWP